MYASSVYYHIYSILCDAVISSLINCEKLGKLKGLGTMLRDQLSDFSHLSVQSYTLHTVEVHNTGMKMCTLSAMYMCLCYYLIW